jgi:hypothetical protein
MTTDNAEGGQLLRAAEELVRNKAAPSGRGSVRYRLAPYRDDLRELLISSPLSIRALARLLETLETPVVVTPNSLNRYLKTEWPDEWESHAKRLRGGSKSRPAVEKENKPRAKSVIKGETKGGEVKQQLASTLIDRLTEVSEKML